MYRVENVQDIDDMPKSLLPDVIYYIGNEENKWLLVFMCPCGKCNKRIHLNLLPEERPLWKFTVESGIPTIEPSVNRTVGCLSHFHLKKGNVQWVFRGASLK